MALLELQGLQHRPEVAEPRVDVDLEPGRQAHEDQAGGLDAGQPDQSAVLLLELAERGLAVDAAVGEDGSVFDVR